MQSLNTSWQENNTCSVTCWVGGNSADPGTAEFSDFPTFCETKKEISLLIGGDFHVFPPQVSPRFNVISSNLRIFFGISVDRLFR